MKSSALGERTSLVEVSNIDSFGVWLLMGDKEYFLPYDDFPWFSDATVAQILNVELVHGEHLRWPDLDVDLCIESLANPERFPLIYN